MANKLASYDDFLNLARQYTKFSIPKDHKSIETAYGFQYALNMLLIKAGVISEVLFEKLNPSSRNKMIQVEGINILILRLPRREYIIPHDQTQDKMSLKKKLGVINSQSKIMYTAYIDGKVCDIYTKLSEKSVLDIIKERKKYDQEANDIHTTLKTKYPWLPVSKIEILIGPA